MGCQRMTKLTTERVAAARAARRSSSSSSVLIAGGFSRIRCLPAWKASTASRACRWLGMQTETMSTAGSPSISS